ncbi:MAG: GIY-YIG nuclease family protein [Kiritimatiellales bacterium]|nr:GIY-YIG nuclease family protein [Kiritimatiellales bacterium]
MIGYVYILQSETSGRYYIGSTNSPDRRLTQHNNGSVKATRNQGPWKRVALIEFKDLSMACKAEYHLKRQKNRRATEHAISGEYPWPSFE